MVFASAQGIMGNFNHYIGNAARRRRLSADRKKKVYRNALGSNSNSSVGSVASNMYPIPMNSRSRGRGRTRSRGRGRGRSRSRAVVALVLLVHL